jgi:nicotinamidase/pyrazinamidase
MEVLYQLAEARGKKGAKAENNALIVVDVQNDFIDGSLPVPGAAEVARKIATELVPAAEQGFYDFMVSTQDWHIDPGKHFEEWPRHCEANTWGAELDPALIGQKFDFQVLKGHHSAAYSGFDGFGPNFMELSVWLRKHAVTEVTIVGIAYDHCVKATAIDAAKLGFKVRVLRPYTAQVDQFTADAALAEMHNAGVEVVY